MFFRPNKLNMTFSQANLFTKHNATIVFNVIWLLNSIKQNLMVWVHCVQFVWLSSIDSEIEVTQRSVFDFVQLPNSITLSWTQSVDWAQSSSNLKRSIDYGWIFDGDLSLKYLSWFQRKNIVLFSLESLDEILENGSLTVSLGTSDYNQCITCAYSD